MTILSLYKRCLIIRVLLYFRIYFANKNKQIKKVRQAPQKELSELLTLQEKRGVAQLVAFLVWDQAVAGSSPVTSTKRIPLKIIYSAGFLFSIISHFDGHLTDKQKKQLSITDNCFKEIFNDVKMLSE